MHQRNSSRIRFYRMQRMRIIIANILAFMFTYFILHLINDFSNIINLSYIRSFQKIKFVPDEVKHISTKVLYFIMYHGQLVSLLIASLVLVSLFFSTQSLKYLQQGNLRKSHAYLHYAAWASTFCFLNFISALIYFFSSIQIFKTEKNKTVLSLLTIGIFLSQISFYILFPTAVFSTTTFLLLPMDFIFDIADTYAPNLLYFVVHKTAVIRSLFVLALLYKIISFLANRAVLHVYYDKFLAGPYMIFTSLISVVTFPFISGFFFLSAFTVYNHRIRKNNPKLSIFKKHTHIADV